MPLLTAADYPAIRAALDISLTSAELPDLIIGLDMYVGAAQRAIRARDPIAESRTGDDLARVRLAAMLWCAALLVPALPQIASETHGDDTYRRQTSDPLAVALELRGRAEAELAAVLNAGTGSRTPRPFAYTRAARFTIDMD